MEKLSEENLLEESDASQNLKEESTAVTTAEEIEDNREVDTDSESGKDSDSESSSDSDFECDVCDRKFPDYLSFRQHQKGKKHAKAVQRKKTEMKLGKTNTATESDDEFLVQEPYAECKVCNKDFFGPESYQQHLKSKKHRQKVLQASILEKVQEDGKVNPEKLLDLYKSKKIQSNVLEDSTEKNAPLWLEDENEKQQEFECKECENQFSGLIPYTQHLMSKIHAKNAKKKGLLHKVIPETADDDEKSGQSKKDDVNTLCLEDGVLVCKSCSMSFSGPENALAHIKSKKHVKNLEKYKRKLEKRKEKKKTKDADSNSSNEKKEESENKIQDETAEEKFQLASDVFDRFDGSGSSTNAIASTSGDKANEELIVFEKYKEYKALMNSLPKDKIIE